MTGFKLNIKKTTPKRHQKLEFQTLKDTTSTPSIHKTLLPRVMCTGKEISWFKISLNGDKRSNTYIQAHFREKN